MAESDRHRIKPLDEKSDYTLWRIRVVAAISAKGLDKVFEPKKKNGEASSSPTREAGCEATVEQCQQASNIIVSALSDHALRVVRSVIGNPLKMMAKLNDRYDSKTIASRISTMSELVSIKYTSLGDDIDKHIDKVEGLIEKLRAMGTVFDDSLAIGILVASIDLPEMAPATAAIKTLADKDVNWESISSRLIDEAKNLKSGTRTRSHAASQCCAICGKTNHTTDRCFLNPLNPNNKLDLKSKYDKSNSASDGPNNEGSNDDDDVKSKKGNKKTKQRSAMARTDSKLHRRPDRMMLDSGTTSHLTSHADRVSNTRRVSVPITLADDSKINGTSRGTRQVSWKTEHGDVQISLSNTIVVPDLSMSLLSIPSLVNKNVAVLFMPGKAVLIDLEDNFSVLGYATQEDDGLFYIDDHQNSVPAFNSRSNQFGKAMMAVVIQEAKSKQNSDKDITRDAEIWHRRLGHTKTSNSIKEMVRNDKLPHVNCSTVNCEPCAKGKFRRSFKGSLTNADYVGRLHVDTKGKVDTQSINGHLYFLTIVDEFSRYTATYPMKRKSEASELLLNFVIRFEKQTGHTVKQIHGDNGTEFMRAFDSLRKKGVVVTTSAAYTPESNGLVERTHSVLLGSMRSCLIQSKLPNSYWNYVIRHVTDCRNFVPHSGTKKIPFEVVFGKPSTDVRHIRPFGCRVEFRPPVKKLRTFESRTDTGIHLFHEGGGIYHIETKNGIVRTKHVNFLETEFPGSVTDLDSETGSDTDTVHYSDSDNFSDSDSDANTVSNSNPDSDSNADSDSESDSDADTVSDSNTDGESDTDSGSETEKSNSEIEGEHTEQLELERNNVEDGQGQAGIADLTYTPSEPSKFGVTPEPSGDEAENEDEIEPTVRGQSGHNLRPQGRVNYSMAALPDSITTDDEPRIKEALASPERKHWILAIDEELETLVDNETWTSGNTPPISIKVLPSMIVLKLKRDENGRPARFKARLVALGNLQVDIGLLIELYAPVICIELVRALLAVAQAKGWSIRQVDFKGAFLNAYLDNGEEIWIRLPNIPGTKFVGQLVKLVKSLYGLRQAPKLWYEYLYSRLRKLGFNRSSASDSLFLLLSDESIIILVYVDDILIMGQQSRINDVISRLRQLFVITDLGKPSHFLGIKLEFRSDGIFLSQPAYIKKVIEMANLTESKPTKYPLPMSHPLYESIIVPSKEDAAKLNGIPFRSVLGALLYLATRTRPDISTAVSMIAKFQSCPTPTHWKMVKHVVRYLKGTEKHGILLPNQKQIDQVDVRCWTDADWARDISNRRSRTGILITINEGPVIWTSKLQTSTALSTSEAEFNALAHSIKELKWLRIVLQEVKAIDSSPTEIKQDNLGSISWTKGVNGLRNVKHVGIKYHAVRDAVESNIVRVEYVPSPENRSDSLTKVIIGDEFAKHRAWLGVTI